MVNPMMRRDRAVWPWGVGLLVLILLIWGISVLLDSDKARVTEVEGEAPEAAVPAGGGSGESAPGEPYAPELIEVLPLGPEDEGRLVRVSGDVVGEPTGEGHWVLTDVDEVIFVRTDGQVESGQNVTNLGRLQPIPEGRAESWIADSGLREAAGWNVHRDFYIDAGNLQQDEGRGSGSGSGSGSGEGEGEGEGEGGAGAGAGAGAASG